MMEVFDKREIRRCAKVGMKAAALVIGNFDIKTHESSRRRRSAAVNAWLQAVIYCPLDRDFVLAINQDLGVDPSIALKNVAESSVTAGLKSYAEAFQVGSTYEDADRAMINAGVVIGEIGLTKLFLSSPKGQQPGGKPKLRREGRKTYVARKTKPTSAHSGELFGETLKAILTQKGEIREGDKDSVSLASVSGSESEPKLAVTTEAKASPKSEVGAQSVPCYAVVLSAETTTESAPAMSVKKSPHQKLRMTAEVKVTPPSFESRQAEAPMTAEVKVTPPSFESRQAEAPKLAEERLPMPDFNDTIGTPPSGLDVRTKTQQDVDPQSSGQGQTSFTGKLIGSVLRSAVDVAPVPSIIHGAASTYSEAAGQWLGDKIEKKVFEGIARFKSSE